MKSINPHCSTPQSIKPQIYCVMLCYVMLRSVQFYSVLLCSVVFYSVMILLSDLVSDFILIPLILLSMYSINCAAVSETLEADVRSKFQTKRRIEDCKRGVLVEVPFDCTTIKFLWREERILEIMEITLN